MDTRSHCRALAHMPAPRLIGIRPGVLSWVCLIAFGILLAGCDSHPGGSHSHENGQKAEDYERGPHRGRMLRSGNFAIEITIFEEGTEPEFRLYAYSGGKPVDAQQVQATVELMRLGGRVDRFAFEPKKDVLIGQGVVHEPHSFDVSVSAVYQDTKHSWNYASYEGRTTIAAEAAEAGGVKAEAAGPATLEETIDLSGRAMLKPQGRAEVRSRYPGRIVSMTKIPGQTVQQGETIVQVESSESFRTFAITAPISGIVVEQNANVGEVTTGQPIYVTADMSKMQARFFVFPRDAERLSVGQPVEIRNLTDRRAKSSIAALLPASDPGNPTIVAYADIPNPDGTWKPGMPVEGSVAVASRQVPLAVRTRALQRFRDFTVVYAKVGDTYEVRMLKLGQRTPEWTEVLEGLDTGEVYVSDGAFLIRADIEKSGASHDH